MDRHPTFSFLCHLTTSWCSISLLSVQASFLWGRTDNKEILHHEVVKWHKKEKVGWRIHSSDGDMSFMKWHKESPFQRHYIWWNSLRNQGVIHTYVWDNEFQMEYSKWLLKRGGAGKEKKKQLKFLVRGIDRMELSSTDASL